VRSGADWDVIVVRLLDGDDWQVWRELRLAALAESPEAFSSTLHDWSGPADTEARWRGRLDAIESNLVAEVAGTAVGMVSVSAPQSGDAELVSMWVAPDVRGSGVGDALVAAALERAVTRGAARVALCVREENAPAIKLYERHGFVDRGRSTPPDAPLPERRMMAEVAANAHHGVERA
jgi:ribosomal protein S18 acetylase RimI-like enzyme